MLILLPKFHLGAVITRRRALNCVNAVKNHKSKRYNPVCFIPIERRPPSTYRLCILSIET